MNDITLTSRCGFPDQPETGFAPSMMMQHILETLKRFAMSDLGVLIVSEDGNETDLIAKTIHRLSGRACYPFVHLDCSTISPRGAAEAIFGAENPDAGEPGIHRGILEHARKGTLFIDHFSLLAPAVQQRVARAIEYQHFRRLQGKEEIILSSRFIIVTHRRGVFNEAGAVGDQGFLHLACPLTINLPPLRQRREDIPYLIREYLTELSSTGGSGTVTMSPEALQACLEYHWPGNAVELRHVLEYALFHIEGDVIQRHHLSPHILYSSGIRNIFAVGGPMAG
ncbi:MAG TPA: sigma 54-interacting transcriptional regulator [Bacteroidota bacterium]|nr:sigma 54-interacting transcriptional regulator [Bacteroidota bacterium]